MNGEEFNILWYLHCNYTTIFFIFEPRIIANSLIGGTDPLFILLIVTSLALVIQKNRYLMYSSYQSYKKYEVVLHKR